MALQGQPPWRPNNPEGYTLFSGSEDTPSAETMHQDKNGDLVITPWVRDYHGGRDAEPDDFSWSKPTYRDRLFLSPQRLKNIVKHAREQGWLDEEKI